MYVVHQSSILSYLEMQTNFILSLANVHKSIIPLSHYPVFAARARTQIRWKPDAKSKINCIWIALQKKALTGGFGTKNRGVPSLCI